MDISSFNDFAYQLGTAPPAERIVTGADKRAPRAIHEQAHYQQYTRKDADSQGELKREELKRIDETDWIQQSLHQQGSEEDPNRRHRIRVFPTRNKEAEGKAEHQRTADEKNSTNSRVHLSPSKEHRGCYDDCSPQHELDKNKRLKSQLIGHVFTSP